MPTIFRFTKHTALLLMLFATTFTFAFANTHQTRNAALLEKIQELTNQVIVLQEKLKQAQPAVLSASTTVKTVIYRDISYGFHKLKKYDVYAPANASRAPVIVMVHGGGWAVGDKANANVVENKVNYWVPKGYVFISINYPMLDNNYEPDEQADAVAAAIEHIQQNVGKWGGNSRDMVVMGHSAGAHLVALVTSDRSKYPDLKRWSGSVFLDSAALDLVTIMKDDPSDVFMNAFGNDRLYWRQNSPFHVLNEKTEPLFIVCSSLRRDSCDNAEVYQDKAVGFGTDAELYPVALDHEAINQKLGLPSRYTTNVSNFIESVM